MVILIDGATGFIGSHLVEYLISKGYKVRATGRNLNRLNGLKKLGAEIVQCDLLDKGEIKDKKILEGVDRIVHCTGCINMSAGWDEMYAGNVQTAKNLYEEALNHDIKKVVHLSSVAVYGKQRKEILKESDPLLAEDNYGGTKILGEEAGLKLYKENGFPFTILRPAFVYGEGDATVTYGLLMMGLLIAEYRKKKVVMNWKRKTHFVSVDNITEAVRFLFDNNSSNGKAYNILDPTIIEMSDIFRYCSEFIPYPETHFGIFPMIFSSDFLISFFSRFSGIRKGRGRFNRLIDKTYAEMRERYDLVPLPAPIFGSGLGRVNKYKKKYALCYDISKILNLGYEPVVKTTEEGIEDTIKWYIDNRWIPDYRNREKK